MVSPVFRKVGVGLVPTCAHVPGAPPTLGARWMTYPVTVPPVTGTGAVQPSITWVAVLDETASPVGGLRVTAGVALTVLDCADSDVPFWANT